MENKVNENDTITIKFVLEIKTHFIQICTYFISQNIGNCFIMNQYNIY